MVAQSRPRRHHGRSRRLTEELGGRRAGGGGQTSGPTGAGQQESAHHSAPHSRAGEASPGAPGAGNICDHLIVSFGKRSEDIKKKTCVLYLGVVSSLYVFRRNRWSLPRGSSVPTSLPCAGCEWRGVGRAHPPSFATPFLGMCAGSCSMYSLGRCSARTRFRRLCLPLPPPRASCPKFRLVMVPTLLPVRSSPGTSLPCFYFFIVLLRCVS